jgi:hypothetical protein
MEFDEKYLFGIVMSYKNLESKICPISLLNLAPKLKFAENRQGTQGILENNSEISSYFLRHI